MAWWTSDGKLAQHARNIVKGIGLNESAGRVPVTGTSGEFLS